MCNWDVVEEIVNWIFYLDIVISMFSPEIDAEGNCCTEVSTVVVGYLKSWFVFDLLVCVPYDQVFLLMSDDMDNCTDNKQPSTITPRCCVSSASRRCSVC